MPFILVSWTEKTPFANVKRVGIYAETHDEFSEQRNFFRGPINVVVHRHENDAVLDVLGSGFEVCPPSYLGLLGEAAL